MAHYPSHLPQRFLTRLWNFFLPGDTYFNFGDGHGPVRAIQGINADGSIRGWVARTAYVGPDAYLGANCVVFGKAQVINKARVTEYAMIFAYAVVSENGQVSRNACVGGRAHIMGHATLGEGTVVEGFATVTGSSICIDCYITDDAQVLEEVELFNCRLRDRSIVSGKTVARHLNARGNGYILGNNSLDYVDMEGIIRVQDCQLRHTVLRQRVVLSNCQLLGINEVDAIELGGGVVVENMRLEGKLQAHDPTTLRHYLTDSALAGAGR